MATFDEMESENCNEWGLAGFSLALLVAAIVAILCGGCVYKGAKVTEGVDFSAGISLPATDGAAQVNFVNYLSGFRLGVAENSATSCEFWGTNRISFAWGLYESESYKRFKAKIEPCETVTTNAPSAKSEGK